MKLLLYTFASIIIITAFCSCKKFIEVSPPKTSLTGALVYQTDQTASAAVTGILQSVQVSAFGGGSSGVSILFGLSSDEISMYPNQDALLNLTYKNALVSNNSPAFWNPFYNLIYQANAAIDGLNNSTGVSASLKKQLVGEAKFLRAFCYFYLVNIYGDVPLITTTDYTVNRLFSRSPKQEVFGQVIADLNEAQLMLSGEYLTPDGVITTERLRPNKGAATALLARTYLYLEKWDSAEVEATRVITDNNFQLTVDLNSVFLKNSGETIWSVEVPNTGFNTFDAASFLSGYIYNGGQPYQYAPFILSDVVVNNFEPGDLRKSNWIQSATVGSSSYYYPYKYKLFYTGAPPDEYPILIRLAELYLVRAEARAQQDNLGGAAADLNIIRNRAGLGNTTAASQAELLNAIYHERQVELFTEYGHRWFDLKRTGQIDAVMNMVTPLKGGTWESSDQLYPIPLDEIQADPNLTQNPGYQ
jgi:starch-binding outer membrane protein, SusD/RagB family